MCKEHNFKSPQEFLDKRGNFGIIPGTIVDIQKYFLQIEFENTFSGEKINPVPKNIITSKVEIKSGIHQDFTIPEWYLRRNRILPP